MKTPRIFKKESGLMSNGNVVIPGITGAMGAVTGYELADDDNKVLGTVAGGAGGALVGQAGKMLARPSAVKAEAKAVEKPISDAEKAEKEQILKEKEDNLNALTEKKESLTKELGKRQEQQDEIISLQEQKVNMLRQHQEMLEQRAKIRALQDTHISSSKIPHNGDMEEGDPYIVDRWHQMGREHDKFADKSNYYNNVRIAKEHGDHKSAEFLKNIQINKTSRDNLKKANGNPQEEIKLLEEVGGHYDNYLSHLDKSINLASKEIHPDAIKEVKEEANVIKGQRESISQEIERLKNNTPLVTDPPPPAGTDPTVKKMMGQPDQASTTNSTSTANNNVSQPDQAGNAKLSDKEIEEFRKRTNVKDPNATGAFPSNNLMHDGDPHLAKRLKGMSTDYVNYAGKASKMTPEQITAEIVRINNSHGEHKIADFYKNIGGLEKKYPNRLKDEKEFQQHIQEQIDEHKKLLDYLKKSLKHHTEPAEVEHLNSLIQATDKGISDLDNYRKTNKIEKTSSYKETRMERGFKTPTMFKEASTESKLLSTAGGALIGGMGGGMLADKDNMGMGIVTGAALGGAGGYGLSSVLEKPGVVDHLKGAYNSASPATTATPAAAAATNGARVPLTGAKAQQAATALFNKHRVPLAQIQNKLPGLDPEVAAHYNTLASQHAAGTYVFPTVPPKGNAGTGTVTPGTGNKSNTGTGAGTNGKVKNKRKAPSVLKPTPVPMANNASQLQIINP